MNTRNADTPEAMMAIGAEIAASAAPGDVFALVGAMGAGKTHWTKGFVAAIDPEAIVSSPTFSIVNEYRGGRCPVFHFDLHRLKSPEELIALGWDEYLDEPGIVVCEWADLFPSLMPENAEWIELTHLPDGARRLRRMSEPGEGAQFAPGW